MASWFVAGLVVAALATNCLLKHNANRVTCVRLGYMVTLRICGLAVY